eukprot:snap_masked-scaffold_69-processed-gene-0.12-mRNA-1 protein AED:0.17 eAED:0.19 QI:0/-1/0/1/-1/1/1/0/445
MIESRKRSNVFEEISSKRLKSLNKSFIAHIESLQRTKSSAIYESAFLYLSRIPKQISSGKVYSFGTGDFGQLGFGVENPSLQTQTTPKLLSTLEFNQPISKITCGGLHTLALSSSGKVFSWGCSDEGVLGRDGDENYPYPVAFPSKVKVASISAGDVHSTFLASTGEVFLSGTFRDKDGRNWTPKGFETTFNLPEQISLNGHKITDISSGLNHVLLLTNNGKVLSFGLGEVGQLGRTVPELKDSNGEYQKEKVLNSHLLVKEIDIPKDKDAGSFPVEKISCGAYHSFIVINFKLFSTGLNNYKQLGLDKEQTKFTLVTSLEKYKIREAKGGEHFSLVLTVFGDLYAFGRCDQSQLGVDLSEEEKKAGGYIKEPRLVMKEVDEVCCGTAHSLVIKKQKVYSFGFGESGQLGLGKEEDESKPKEIKTNKKALSIGCGGQHSVILLED